MAVPDVVRREQPKPVPTVAAFRRKHDALALYSLRRVNETRRPIWRPLRLADRSKKRRHICHRTVQCDCERLCPLFGHCRSRYSSQCRLHQRKATRKYGKIGLHRVLRYRSIRYRQYWKLYWQTLSRRVSRLPTERRMETARATRNLPHLLEKVLRGRPVYGRSWFHLDCLEQDRVDILR